MYNSKVKMKDYYMYRTPFGMLKVELSVRNMLENYDMQLLSDNLRKLTDQLQPHKNSPRKAFYMLASGVVSEDRVVQRDAIQGVLDLVKQYPNTLPDIAFGFMLLGKSVD